MPGRPTRFHHRDPYDNVRDPYDRQTASPLSKLHALTVMSAEQQTMNFYMNTGPTYMEPIARELYQEIGLIEEEHVTHYESLVDPGETWWEQLVNHEYNECYLYHSFMQQEPDPRIRALWELHLNMEVAQLQSACEMLRRYEGREPIELGLPTHLPEPVSFEPLVVELGPEGAPLAWVVLEKGLTARLVPSLGRLRTCHTSASGCLIMNVLLPPPSTLMAMVEPQAFSICPSWVMVQPLE